MAASFAVPILLGAALGFLALRQAPEIVTLSVLALTGGALVAMDSRARLAPAGPVFLTAGFAIFGAISVYGGA